MAFWNKSEDPWDRKPEKRNAPAFTEAPEQPPAGESETLADRARTYFGIGKKEPEAPPAPIPCPWCGKETQTGYIYGPRSVLFAPGIPSRTAKWIGINAETDSWNVATLGETFSYQTAWYCKDCGKLVVDVPAPDPEWQARLERTMETHPKSDGTGGEA